MTTIFISNSFDTEKLVGNHSTETTRTRTQVITKKQIAALKYMINQTPVASTLLKQILTLLIKRSGKLTKDVSITISMKQGYTTNELLEAAYGLQEMCSVDGSINLHALIHLTGSRLMFCWHNTTSQFGYQSQRENYRYTFWLAKKPYSQTAKKIRVTKSMLDSINITNSGLYPHLQR